MSMYLWKRIYMDIFIKDKMRSPDFKWNKENINRMKKKEGGHELSET